jgi:ribosome-binding ATPase YchF (GTP1/OBG family)
LPLLKQFFLITAKPAMFVANVSEDGFENNPTSQHSRFYNQTKEIISHSNKYSGATQYPPRHH